MTKQRSENNKPLNVRFTLKPLVKHVSIALTFGAGALLANNFAYAEEVEQANTQQSTKINTKPKESADTDGSRLGAVTVTAQKREENIQEISNVVTALDGQELQDKGIGRSANEVLNYVPNASAATMQHGRPRWWIRGVGAGQQQLDLASPIGFYQDEVYISNANATGFPLFDLDQVEVLRGPQGTLWGKNTTGGAIAISSKKPSFNETENDDYLKVDYGSYNDKIVEGAVGVVLIPEKLSTRISFHQEDADGRFNNVNNGSKDGGLQDGAIRGQLLAELTPNLEALLNFHYRKYETDGAITTVASNNPSGLYTTRYGTASSYYPSTDPNVVSTNAPNFLNTSQNGASLNLKWQLGKYTLTSISGYEDYVNKTALDADYIPLDLKKSYVAADSNQFTQELRLASPKDDRWNWIAGLYYFNEKVNSNSSIWSAQSSAAAENLQNAIYSQKAESSAIFGSTTYNFTDKLATTVGARWSTESKDLVFSQNQYNSGASANPNNWWTAYGGTLSNVSTKTFAQSLSKKWDAFTYDISPSYKITPNDLVFAKYAHGEKSGGFNTAASSSLALLEVKPEKLDSYELGYKSSWLDQRINFNATAFYYEYKDAQVNAVNAGVSYLENASKAHSKGLEFELEALPTERLHLKSDLGLLSAKFDDFTDAFGTHAVYTGNQLVRSPHLTFDVAADYFVPVANGAKVVFGADARYTSQQYYFLSPQDVTNRGYTQQEAFTIANARISFVTAKNKYTLTAYVNNLFDKQYENHALPLQTSTTVLPGNVNGDGIYWAQPRTAGLSLTARF